MAGLTDWLGRVRSAGQSTPVAIGALLVANALPLIGVLFFGWDVGLVLVAYWLENGVIGLLNIPKIILAGRSETAGGVSDRMGVSERVIFFAIHYGIFWVVHGAFVFFLIAGGPFGFFGGGGVDIDARALLLVGLVLLISHGASFVTNYVGKREYLRTNPAKQVFQPYGRVIALHFTILIGGAVVIRLGQPVILVVLLVVFKTLVDLRFHLREHPPIADARAVV